MTSPPPLYYGSVSASDFHASPPAPNGEIPMSLADEEQEHVIGKSISANILVQTDARGVGADCGSDDGETSSDVLSPAQPTVDSCGPRPICEGSEADNSATRFDFACIGEEAQKTNDPNSEAFSLGDTSGFLPNFGCLCRLLQRAAPFFVGAVLITSIALLASSTASVEYTEWGLRRNKLTRVDFSEVHGAGLYWWGPSSTAVKFPSTWQRMCMKDLNVFSSGGQTLSISLCFTYAFSRDTVPKIFQAVGVDYAQPIRVAATGAMKNAASTLAFTDYSQARKSSADTLHQAVATGLQSAALPVEVPRAGFFLGVARLPAAVLNLTLSIFANEEDRLRLEYESQSRGIRLNTTAEVAKIEAHTHVLDGTAEAEADRHRASAVNQAVADMHRAQGGEIQLFRSELALSDDAVKDLSRMISLFEANNSITFAAPVVNVAPQV